MSTEIVLIIGGLGIVVPWVIYFILKDKWFRK